MTDKENRYVWDIMKDIAKAYTELGKFLDELNRMVSKKKWNVILKIVRMNQIPGLIVSGSVKNIIKDLENWRRVFHLKKI